MANVFLLRDVRVDGVDKPGNRVYSDLSDGTIDSLINSGWGRPATDGEVAAAKRKADSEDRDEADTAVDDDDDDGALVAPPETVVPPKPSRKPRPSKR